MPVYLLDENVHKPDKIITRCEAEGIKVIRVHQVNLEQTDDSEIFQYAMANGLVVVTGNIRDFSPEQRRWIEAGNEFPGVIYLSTVHYRNVEDIIREIIEVEKVYHETQLREWWV
jgi:predicted nuclease of predicted toxin-antitoxin system